MKENINIELKGATGDVNFRTGPALPQFHPDNAEFNGQLFAPSEYIAKNYSELPDGEVHPNAVILVDKKNDAIVFDSDIKAVVGRVKVRGHLTRNPKLQPFAINSGDSFSKTEIQRILRQNAVLFKDVDSVKKLIKVLDDLQLTTEETIKDAKDNRGNVDQAFKRTVRDAKGLLPEYIELFTEIFVGFEKVSIKLEIEIDLDGRMPVYSFYCLEYDLIVEQQKEAAFAFCLTPRMVNDFTVLTVS